MTQRSSGRMGTPRSGFTLIELLVVVLIIGILAAIAVPQYFKVVEKGKAAESLTILDTIRGGQERYLSNNGTYCGTAAFACTGFDVALPTLKYFTIGTPSQNASPGWSLALTRNATPAVYGAYVVSMTVNPGAAPIITSATPAVVTDLLPQ